MRVHNKRVLAVLFVIVLVLTSTLNYSVSFATDNTDRITHIRTNYNNTNYIDLEIKNGNQVALQWKLSDSSIDKIAMVIGDEALQTSICYSNNPNAASTVVRELGNNVSNQYLKIYVHRVNNGGAFWTITSNELFLLRDGAGYYFKKSDSFDSNILAVKYKLNPENYLDTSSVDPSIAKLSREICMGETDNYKKAHMIYYWVADNIYYDYDYLYDRKLTVNIDPVDVYNSRVAVCSGYSTLMVDLLRSQGIPSFLAICDSQNDNVWNFNIESIGHAYVEAWVNNRWIYMDPTWGSSNSYEYGIYERNDDLGVTETYFDTTIEYLSESRFILYRGDIELFDCNYNMTSEMMDWIAQQSIPRPSGWAEKEISAAKDNKLFDDAEISNYQAQIDRGNFCSLLMRMLRIRYGVSNNNDLLKRLGFSEDSNIKIFSDTSNSDVNAAAILGITQGVGDNKFDPGSKLTREQAATFLVRTANLIELTKTGTAINYTDLYNCSTWAQSSISEISTYLASYRVPVMQGVGDNRFDGKSPYTYEQSIITVYRMFTCD